MIELFFVISLIGNCIIIPWLIQEWQFEKYWKEKYKNILELINKL